MENNKTNEVDVIQLTEYEKRIIIILTGALSAIEKNDDNHFLSHKYPSYMFNELTYFSDENLSNYIETEYQEINKFQLIIKAINSTEKIISPLLNDYPKVKLFLDIIVLMNLIKSKLIIILIDKKYYIEYLKNLKIHMENNLITKYYEEIVENKNNVLHYIQYRKLEEIFIWINSDYIEEKLQIIIDRLDDIIIGYSNYNNINALMITISREQYDNIYNAFYSFHL